MPSRAKISDWRYSGRWTELCGAPHNADYVGLPVMLREAGSGAWTRGFVNFNVT